MTEWILAIVFVEAVTEILVASQIFQGFRDWLFQNLESLHKLVNCGYCLSVWVAGIIAWALPGIVTGYFIPDMVIKLFVLHRASNGFHELLTRWFKRIPWTISLHKTNTNFDMIEDFDEPKTETES